MKPTIHDVAALAGVAVGTASKALNGRGSLSQATQDRVQAAASQLGFYPNDLAKSLVRGRTFTVGLVSTDSYGRFSIPLITGIEDALGSERVSIFLCNSRDDPSRERQHIESLISKRVDGILITGRRTDVRAPIDARGVQVPVLYVYAQTSSPDDFCLLPDDVQGGRLATEHLIATGRRHLAHITGPTRFEAVRHREFGMRQVMNERQLPMPERKILSGPWGEAWGFGAAQQLLQNDREVDAIFCGSDQLARGAVDGLREAGVRVPDDIAVVGFDNWEVIAAATRPPLTTIDMNLHDLGRAAGQQLLAMVSGKSEVGVVRQPCQLVVRDSCGARAYGDAEQQPEGGSSM